MTKSVKINNIEDYNEELIAYHNNRYAIATKNFGFDDFNPDTMDDVPDDYYQIRCGFEMMPADWESEKFYSLDDLETAMRDFQSDLRKWTVHTYE